MDDAVDADQGLAVGPEHRRVDVGQDVEDGEWEPDDAVRQGDRREKFVGLALTQVTRVLLLAQVLVDECVDAEDNQQRQKVLENGHLWY